jgi:hypothetical protein
MGRDISATWGARTLPVLDGITIASEESGGGDFSMRTTIGLIGLGVAGGTVPTGLSGLPDATVVVAAAAGAVTLLLGVCLAAPALVHRRSHATRRTVKTEPFPPAVASIRSVARGT